MLTSLRNRFYIAHTACIRLWLRHVWGMHIGKGVRISRQARLDTTYPAGIHIGDYTMVAPGARIFTHNFITAGHEETRIGKKCFIGANALVMPGISIGDHCIIAAGSVVTKNVADRTLVGGNPAKVLKDNLITGNYGRQGIWVDGLE